MIIRFELSAESNAPALDVQDIVLMVDGSYKFRPVGFRDMGWGYVGKFTGTFTPGGADLLVKFHEDLSKNPDCGYGVKTPGFLVGDFVYVVALGTIWTASTVYS